MARVGPDRHRQRTGAYNLLWRGKQIEEAARRAAIDGLNVTMKAAVEQAKINAPYKTGALRDDIDYRPAQESGTRIIGRWGNWDVRYSIFQEYGTVFIEPRFYLRRAADQEYPHLNERIAAYYKKYAAS